MQDERRVRGRAHAGGAVSVSADHPYTLSRLSLLTLGGCRERPPGFFFAAVEYLDESVRVRDVVLHLWPCMTMRAAIVFQHHKVVRTIEAEAAEEKSNEDDARSIGGAPVVVAKMVIPDVDG
jgi:hypothetical protein